MAALMLVILSALTIISASPTLEPGAYPSTTLPNAEPPFVSEPQGRGTVRLLLSCTITLILCVWTAIHMNIISNPTTARFLQFKALYVLMGLFAPEIVLATAYTEWKAACAMLQTARLVDAPIFARAAAKEAETIAAEIDAKFQLTVSPHSAACSAIQAALEAAQVARQTSVAAELAAELADDASTDASRAWDRTEFLLQDEKDSLEHKERLAIFQGKMALEAASKAVQTLKIAERIILRPRQSWANILRSGLQAIYKMWIALFVARWRGPIGYIKERDLGMEGSFFVVMGGYTFTPRDSYTSKDALTFTVKGLSFLLQTGVIMNSDLSGLKGEVADKGKADILAKFLICVQALWMMINCLCRKIEGLPVTLIELNVVMHVVCVMVMYKFWWKKPHDVGRPISLSPMFLDEGIRALLFTMGKYGSYFRASRLVPGPRMNLWIQSPITDPAERIQPEDFPVNSSGLSVYGELPIAGLRVLKEIRMATRMDGVVMIFKDQLLVDEKGGWNLTHNEEAPIHLTKRDLDTMTASAHELREPRFPNLKMDDNTIYGLYTLPREIFRRSAQNLPDVNSSLVAVVLLCLFYGGAHASAWNSHFPSPMEQHLWRVSCVLIAAPGLGISAIALPIMIIVGLRWAALSIVGLGRSVYIESSTFQSGRRTVTSTNLLEKQDSSSFLAPDVWAQRLVSPMFLFVTGWVGAGILAIMSLIGYNSVRGVDGEDILTFAAAVASVPVFLAIILSVKRAREAVETPMRFLCVVATCFYVVGRVYIVVESFICVRSLPYGAFKSVSWERFWPHF